MTTPLFTGDPAGATAPYQQEPKRFVGAGFQPSRSGKDIGTAVPGLVRDVWGMEKLAPRFPKLDRNLDDVDVLIVGAGMAGISLAYYLQKGGKRVALCEARCIGAGQSGRTSAHIMEWFDDYYCELERREAATQVSDGPCIHRSRHRCRKHDTATASLVARSMVDAIQLVEDNIR